MALNDFRVLGPARRELAAILATSKGRFGEQQAERYHSIFLRVFASVRDQPTGPETRAIGTSISGLRGYHLKWVPQPRLKIVKRPRHVIIFRHLGDRVTVIRILHERMDQNANSVDASKKNAVRTISPR